VPDATFLAHFLNVMDNRAMADHRDPPLHTREPAELPHFRFGLRQMLGFVAVLCGLLTMMVILGGLAALVILLLTLVVAAHVTGTALGTRLRAHADREIATAAECPEASPPVACASPQMIFIRRSSWHGSDRTPFARMPRMVLLGLSAGAVAGGLLLILAAGRQVTAGGVVVGAMSSAVLGGWFAFVGSRFVAMFRYGWQEALADEMADQ
jgi:hypothetical protein